MFVRNWDTRMLRVGVLNRWHDLSPVLCHHMILEEPTSHFFEASFMSHCYSLSSTFYFPVLGESSVHHKSKVKIKCLCFLGGSVYSSLFFPARDGSLGGEFLDVGPSLNWGVLTPGENERIKWVWWFLHPFSLSSLSQSWVSNFPMASKWKS